MVPATPATPIFQIFIQKESYLALEDLTRYGFLPIMSFSVLISPTILSIAR